MELFRGRSKKKTAEKKIGAFFNYPLTGCQNDNQN